MHQIFATFFSLLIALCHHTSLTARPVEAAEVSAPITAPANSPAMILPDRYQLARSASGYAENACVSCRRMDGSSSDR
jgi:hypothetical protein